MEEKVTSTGYIKNKLSKFFAILRELVSRDLKLKYRRSVLGYLWSVLDPLLMMLVMYLVFSNLFGRGIEKYPAYLMSGQVLFNFMRQGSTQAMNSIVNNAALLKKTYVPYSVFPVSSVTSALVNMLFTLIALVIIILFMKVRLTWHALLFPVPIIEVYFFTLGLGMFLAQATVFFRDVQHIWEVFTLAWIYLTPIFYQIESLPEALAELIKVLNPMYAYIGQFRDIVLYNRMPGYKVLIVGVAWPLIMMLIGWLFFKKNKKKFILYI